MHWLLSRFELSRNDGSGNVRPMEGLRGFAVFLVFLVHYVTLMAPWITKNSPLEAATVAVHAFGNAGVDLFFVLSGYLIYGSLMKQPQPFVAFMRRRAKRIYPAFLIVFAIYLVLSFLQPSASKLPHESVSALIYVVENLLLLPGIFKIDPIITVAWSLSYEMLYYLVLPPLLLVLNLRVRSSQWRSGFFAITGLIIIVLCTAYDGPLRLVMFIAGILLYESLRAKKQAPDASLVVILVIVSFLFTTAPYVGPVAWAMRVATLFMAFYFLCLHCFSVPDSWLTRIFSLAPLRWLGNMSYSYYLIHGLTLKIVVLLLTHIIPHVQHETIFLLAVLPFIFFATLLPAMALFLLIERPFSLHKHIRLPSEQTPSPSKIA